MPRYIIHSHTAVVNEGAPGQGSTQADGPKYDIHTDHFVVNEHTDSAAETGAAEHDLTADEILPPQLLSAEAGAVWQQLIDAKLLTPDWQLAPSTTKAEGMYIALELSCRFLGATAWRPFERFWHKTNMAQACQKMKDTGVKPKRWREITGIVAGH